MGKVFGRRRAALWGAPPLLFSLLLLALPFPVQGQLGLPPAGVRPPEVRVKFLPGQAGIASMALQRFSALADAVAPQIDPRVPVDQPYLQPAAAHSQIGWYVYRLPAGERADVAAARIRTLPGVQYAEPVQRVRLANLAPPNDPAYTEYEKGTAVFPIDNAKDSDTWRMQWNLHFIKALEGWSVWPGKYFTAADKPRDAPIIAIIDSGIDTSHADFANVGDPSTNVQQGGQINGALSRNLINGGANPAPNDPRDENGHGTHMAGIAAAAGNNGRYPGRTDRGFGVIGVGYNAQIAAIKVIDASGNGTDTDVVDAILFAADNGALVLNLSVATDGGYSQALQDAVNYAWARGCVIVAAAGNDGVSLGTRYPAGCDKVIGVGATTGEHGIWVEQRASYSNHGLPLSVSAPGGDLIIDIIDFDLGLFNFPVPVSMFMWIWSTAPTYTTPLTAVPIHEHTYQYYGYLQGTSPAAPHVSGLAALYAGYRGITQATPAGNLRIAQAIERGAENLSGVGGGGWQITYGFGRINVENTMKEVNARNTSFGTVTGQVYYNTTAVPNASITAVPLGGTRRYIAGSQSDGYYRLINLPAGDYEVRASFFGQVRTRRVTVLAGGNSPGVTFYMGDVKGDATLPSRPSLETSPVANSSPLRVDARWWSRDTETGISHYEYAIGSTPGGTDVVNWTGTHKYEMSLTLPAGTPVRAHWLSVRAVNGEGAVGEPTVNQIQ